MRPTETEREIKKAQRDLEQDTLNNAYKITFATPHGRIVLDDLCKKAMLWVTTFTGNSHTYFNEGKRDLALYILKRTNTADPNIIIKLMSEKLDLKLEREINKNK